MRPTRKEVNSGKNHEPKIKQNDSKCMFECFSNNGVPESAYVDVDNQILLSNQEHLPE